MKKARTISMRQFSLLLCLLILAAVFMPGIRPHAAGITEEIQVDNGIPVVYLRIDESRGSVEDMMTSPDHSVYCYGSLSIEVPEGFRYSDFPDQVLQNFEGLEMSIRGRGNSTWQKMEKRPFKIKLDKKADLFGLGSNKHWVLIANYNDETLLRDRITAWIGDEMGFVFTPRGVPVDLVMIGDDYGTQYLGSYYFSENVRVGENRLEIEELEEGDTDSETITGGYLLQNALQVRPGSPDRFYTSRGIDWATHTPSFDTEDSSLTGVPEFDSEEEEAFAESELGDGYKNNAQQEYIQNYIQHFEDVLFEEGTAYRDLMDLESTAKYWLVNMISLNSDAYGTGSTYLYKDRDPENGVAKLYWGPLWDFDYAWDNRYITSGLSYGHEWMKPMFYDTGEGGFVEELHKYWPVMRDAMERLIADGGLLDQYYEETKASAEKDHMIYHPDRAFDYHEEVEELRTWIRDRIAWVDENFSMIDSMMHKITFIVNDEVYRTEFRSSDEFISFDEKHPEVEGFTFVGWLDPQGEMIESPLPVSEDLTITAKYVPDSEMTHGSDIAFPRDSDIVKYSPFFKVYTVRHTVLPEDAQDKAVSWYSSDESIATVNHEGVVTFYGTGTVTLTADLRLGNTRTFTLTITGDELPAPKSIHAVDQVIRINAGEQSPLTIRTNPSPVSISSITYEPEDPSVVSVSDLGVLTGLKAGKSKVKISAQARDGETEINVETHVNVFVSDKNGLTEEIAPEESSTTQEPVSEPLTDTPAEENPEGSAFGFDAKWIWIPAVCVAAAAVILVLILRKKKSRKQE